MNVYVHPHPYNQAFDEVAETIRRGLKKLAATGFTLPDRTIYIGAHLLAPNTQPDDRRIFYNFEQRDSPQLNASVLHLFRQHEVWDYSPSNVTWFSDHGILAKHVPIGYISELTRIPHTVDQDIDVLFYGLVNDRRRKILDGLRAAGLNVCDVFKLYGTARDALISRSKVVLNVHYYDTKIFEIVRCFYLFANAVCVVSEESVDVPPELSTVMPFTPYDRLVQRCKQLVDDPFSRSVWATQGYHAFRRSSEVQILREAIYGPRLG